MPVFPLATNNSSLLQMLQEQKGGLLWRSRGGVDGQLRMGGGFVGIVNAGKVFQLPGPGLFIEPFRVSLLAGLNRSVDVNLDKRQLGLLVQGPDAVAIFSVGANEAGHGNDAAIGK